MRGAARAALRIVGFAAAIAVAVLAFDFLGVLALVGQSALLVIALRVRSAVVALIVGVGAAIFLVLLLRVISSCNPSLEDCSPDVYSVLWIGWLAMLAVGGAVAAIYVWRRQSA